MAKVADGFWDIAQAVFDIAAQAAANPEILRKDPTQYAKDIYTAVYGKDPKGMAAIQQLMQFVGGWQEKQETYRPAAATPALV